MIVLGEKPAAVGAADRQNMINSNTHQLPNRISPSKVFRLAPVNRRALQRRNELIRLAKYLRANGLREPDDIAWATVVADLVPWCFATGQETTADDLAVAIACRVRAFAVSAGLELCGDAVGLAASLAAESPKTRPMSNRRAGALLGITAADREEISARTLDAIDESATARRRRLAKERSARKRAKRGAKPHNKSFSKTRPWEAEGVSRRTWERNRKDHTMSENTTRDANSYPHPYIKEEGSVTNLRQLDRYIAIQTAEYKRAESIVAMATKQHQDYIDQCMSAVRRLPPDFWRNHVKPEAIAAGLID